MRQWPVPFAVGLALGIVGTALLAPGLTPVLPEAWRPKQTLIVGEILQKVDRGDQLRLVVETEWGALLASFTGEAGEKVRVLVEEGDEVAFAMGAYQAFVDNPEVVRVLKAVHRPRAVNPGKCSALRQRGPRSALTSSRVTAAHHSASRNPALGR